MLVRAWLLVAAIGIALGSLGQAQEQAQAPQETTPPEQPPAQTLPIPLPVDIVEDQAAAEARQRSEAEARQREIDDLAAQQGMNVAAQAMNEANQTMALYSTISTALVGIGTALLFVTLWLTWQANRAAVRSVEIVGQLGEAELRAYVKVSISWRSHWIGDDKSKIFWRFHLALANIGTTPTRNLKFRRVIQLLDAKDTLSGIPDDVASTPGTIGSKDAIGIAQFDVHSADMEAMKEGEKALFIFVEATYENVLNRKSRHIVRSGLKSSTVTGYPSLYWHDTDNPVNVVFSHIGSFNCTDDECEA